MKKVFEELRLIMMIMCLDMAVSVAPKKRQESTLLLYYIRHFLRHKQAMAGGLGVEKKQI
jgi:hypothetical protein